MGIIYKIECLETGLVYYGQTTQTLKKRFISHKSKFKIGDNHTHSVYEVLKNGFAFASVVEVVDDESMLCEREFFYIKNNECVNQINGNSLDDLYYTEYRKTYMEDYYKDNKENLLEYYKKYREANHEALLEKSKKYRETNKEAILAKQKEKYTCECGSTLRKSDKARHEKSQTHKAYLENLNK